MIRPILDGLLVRMEAKPKQVGLIHVPDNVHVQSAKVGTVLAVGPGRSFRRRLSVPFNDHNGRKVERDNGSAGGLVPMTVKVGDRVLFDPLAELRPVVVDGETLHVGAEFQCAAVLYSAQSEGGTDYDMGEPT